MQGTHWGELMNKKPGTLDQVTALRPVAERNLDVSATTHHYFCNFPLFARDCNMEFFRLGESTMKGEDNLTCITLGVGENLEVAVLWFGDV
ncbi:hypothetical protein JTE90_027362 [Oedothorax gibbosus]|uniref:Uncharacterized protein n=1 Tax=Oedothorax gibbosus TaxID=931172 RepID=A0AAV6W134_9ARAC|nr:hypothetical protein JTE90_027362 [Oedothorax gibbosus]